MTPQNEALAFLEALARKGVELRPEVDRIRYRPAAALTADDKGRLQALKPILLSMLVPVVPDHVLDELPARPEAPLSRALEGMGISPSPEGGGEMAPPSGPCDPTMEALCQALPEDAQHLREERAGILQHEAGIALDEAERRAGLR